MRDLVYAQEFCNALKGYSPLITAAVAPHSLYSCDAQTLMQAHDFSHTHDVPFIIHVAEQKNEILTLRKKTGLSPSEYMQSLVLLSPRVIIAHGVHFSDADLAIVGKSGASIIYNPTSNMKLGSGIARVKSMQEHGIAVGLGTDGTASNNALDAFAEMKTGALLQDLCVEDYCKPLTPFEVVKLATIDGARALKMDHKIGSLQVGKAADMIIMNRQDFAQLPSYDVYSQIVYASKSTDVQTVIIDGKIVMHKRRMVTLFDKVAQLRERIAHYQKAIKNI